jgi:serine/threonine protein kinase
LLIYLGQLWNKRSTKAKQLILKMLAKKPEDRISAE